MLDLGLIDGSGEEVLRYVREAGMPSRVAVVSGHIDPSSILGLKPWKPDVLLTKPIHFEDLLAACEAHGSEDRQPASDQVAESPRWGSHPPKSSAPQTAQNETRHRISRTHLPFKSTHFDRLHNLRILCVS